MYASKNKLPILIEGGPASIRRTILMPLLALFLAVTGCDSEEPLQPNDQQLAALERLTDPFQDFSKAQEAGWNVQATPCWEHATLGAMGYHYGNPEFLGDGEIDLLEPELLMYVPNSSGDVRLVGMEYIVDIEAWDAQHDSPPTLVGQEFHPHGSLPIYKLHIWLWQNNSRGMFADWNPEVSCEFAAETEIFD